MIALHKLERLPRHQRLRKILKLFAEAERRAAGNGEPPAAALSAAAELLTGDGGFSPEVREALCGAAAALKAAPVNGASSTNPAFLRAVNTVRHLLLAETGRFPADWDFINHEGLLDPSRRRVFPGVIAYLEDIRSPFNVGAMFRTAESFGAERLYLSPLCADPRHPRAARTAMGCTAALPWERRVLAELPGPFFALETGGTPLRNFAFPQNGVMITGSEELGVSPAALALADASLGRASIPVLGAKGSLNVSAAFAVAMYAWAERLGTEGLA
jgi:TrmH family RNA methyltransferase